MNSKPLKYGPNSGVPKLCEYLRNMLNYANLCKNSRFCKKLPKMFNYAESCRKWKKLQPSQLNNNNVPGYMELQQESTNAYVYFYR